ncbi:MAG: tetratricopeptide repeat protein [Candidatus Binataceae bacterium]|jgi:tetratricopeptide (TPR) repeat protein
MPAGNIDREMGEAALKQRALELWNQGVDYHLHGDFRSAIALYDESIEVFPTAEAYTFRGWAFRFLGRIDDAIAECHKAITVDPAFGNPYNDIGSYLMSKGDLDEAVEWFEKAKAAPRYEPRHYPFMNLGRLYAAKGMVLRAIQELEGALAIDPGEASCLEMLDRLRAQLN